MDRRAFFQVAAGAASIFVLGGVAVGVSGEHDLLRPPGGQDEARFIGACIHCDRCRSVCPQSCIGIAKLEDGIVNARTPRLDFHKGYCDFCGKCISVCPSQSLVPFDVQTEKVGVAKFEQDRCAHCTRCVSACEYGALTWDDKNAIPIIDESACNGCGKCEYACPSASYGYYNGSHDRAIHVVKA